MSVHEEKNDVLSRLQEWYSDQCNGDWEHTYGVKLDTLDNPGWILTIDLAETDLASLSVPRDRCTRSEFDWAQHEVVDGRFVACGGPFNLEELIRRFLALLPKPGAPSP